MSLSCLDTVIALSSRLFSTPSTIPQCCSIHLVAKFIIQFWQYQIWTPLLFPKPSCYLDFVAKLATPISLTNPLVYLGSAKAWVSSLLSSLLSLSSHLLSLSLSFSCYLSLPSYVPPFFSRSSNWWHWWGKQDRVIPPSSLMLLRSAVKCTKRLSLGRISTNQIDVYRLMVR